MKYTQWMFLPLAVMLAFGVSCERHTAPESPKFDPKIEAQVIKVIATQFNLDPATLSPEEKFFGPRIQGDDLDLVEVVMELEDQFGIYIPDEAPSEVAEDGQYVSPTDMTIGDLIEIVQAVLKTK